MRIASFFGCVALLCTSTYMAVAAGAGEKKGLSDARIREILIQESIDAYSGNCPCPYSTARNGSRCGRRSAYSRLGGDAPFCYAKDISAEMVRRYRESHADA